MGDETRVPVSSSEKPDAVVVSVPPPLLQVAELTSLPDAVLPSIDMVIGLDAALRRSLQGMQFTPLDQRPPSRDREAEQAALDQFFRDWLPDVAGPISDAAAPLLRGAVTGLERVVETLRAIVEATVPALPIVDWYWKELGAPAKEARDVPRSDDRLSLEATAWADPLLAALLTTGIWSVCKMARTAEEHAGPRRSSRRRRPHPEQPSK